MTVKQAAAYVAEQFNKDVKENGFEDFKEMKTTYWWDAKDIRAEIDYMVTHDCDGVLFLDSTVENFYDVHDAVSYREFKKMVFAEVK